MEQFRTASEARHHNPMSPRSLTKGRALGPTGVPAAEAQGPVTHMPILGFDPVYQGWSDSKMERRTGCLTMAGFPSSGRGPCSLLAIYISSAWLASPALLAQPTY